MGATFRPRQILFAGVGYSIQDNAAIHPALRGTMRAKSLSLCMPNSHRISGHRVDRIEMFLVDTQGLRSVSYLR